MADLVDIKEARKLTGYSGGYLRELAGKGAIEGRKVGNAWALDKESLLAFAAKRQRNLDGRYGSRSEQR